MDSTAQKLGLLHRSKTNEWVGFLVWSRCLCEKAQIHFPEKADLDLFKICLNSQRVRPATEKLELNAKKKVFGIIVKSAPWYTPWYIAIKTLLLYSPKNMTGNLQIKGRGTPVCFLFKDSVTHPSPPPLSSPLQSLQGEGIYYQKYGNC